jgi:hypothetical protein
MSKQTPDTDELYERALKGFDTVNGIRLLPVGEDEITFVAIGHHHPKTVLKAFNAEAKGLLGWLDLVDGDHVPAHGDDCDEENCPRHEPDSWLDDLTHRVEQSWAYFHEHATFCDDEERNECSCDEYGWYITWDAKQDRNTFPVTYYRV